MCKIFSDDPCVYKSVQKHMLWFYCGINRHVKVFDVYHVNRTAYYTAYRQVYRQDYQTVYKCCPGWSQLNGEAGCLYRKYPQMFKFFSFFSCKF